MADVNEIRALKASLRGAIDTAGTLNALQEKVEAIDEHGDVTGDFLDELSRVTVAHAIASNALRGFIEMMMKRRGVGVSASDAAASGE